MSLFGLTFLLLNLGAQIRFALNWYATVQMDRKYPPIPPPQQVYLYSAFFQYILIDILYSLTLFVKNKGWGTFT